MTHEPDWLTKVLEELAEHEVFPATPPFANRVLDSLLARREASWPFRVALVSAATLSLSAAALVALRIATGRWTARGHA